MVGAGCTGVSSLAVMAVYWVLDIRDVQERLACRLFDVDYLDANPDRPHLIWTLLCCQQFSCADCGGRLALSETQPHSWRMESARCPFCTRTNVSRSTAYTDTIHESCHSLLHQNRKHTIHIINAEGIVMDYITH